jgi:hypothetical protein
MEEKKEYLKCVFFTHIYVTIAFSIRNNKINPKISQLCCRAEHMGISLAEYLLLSREVDVCVSHESYRQVSPFL